MARNIPLGSNSFAGAIGQGLGQGIESITPSILSFLAENKAYKIAADHYRTLNPNLTDAEAQAIVRQSPAIQQAALGWPGNSPRQQLQQAQPVQSPVAQPQQMPQQQAPQIPQVSPQQLQLMQPNGLQALQLAGQGIPNKIPSIAEQEFLRRLPEPAKRKLGMRGLSEFQPQENGLLFNRPQSNQIPNAQPNQQLAAPNVNPTQQIASGLTLGDFISQNLGGKARTKEQISKEDQQFGLELQKRIDFGREVESDLDRIENLIDKPDIQWGLIASKVPVSQLNTNTKKLTNLFSDILVKQTKAAGQGRGSDLLRKMVQEGKFSLEQGPEVWHDIANRLREEIDYDKQLYKARHEILKEYGGKPPADIGYLARERAAQEIRQEPKTESSFTRGSSINELPKPGSPEARQLEGRALEGPNGPIIYQGGKPYPAEKRNGKWVRR